MNKIQADDVHWLIDSYLKTIDELHRKSPVEYSEAMRYLPRSVTSDPGYIKFDRTPYWIEILECFDVRSPVREVAVLKAVQTAYSTVLESIMLYFAGHIRTSPVMYSNATVDMARARIETNYIPMFEQSGLSHIFQSPGGNSRKKGITKDRLQWIGGGFMVPKGAQKAHMMREIAVHLLLMDELDGWPDVVDGDPVDLFKDRTTGFTDVRKIFMGSTPAIADSSKIARQWHRGDQREYHIRCLKCGFPHVPKFNGKNKETGKDWGLKWEFTEEGTLDIEAVRYHCPNCNNAHMEHDKVKLITKDNCEWRPSKAPAEPNCRSYKVPGMISRRSPWYKGVSMWLEAYDVENNRVKSQNSMQRFYNNFLAEPYEMSGGKVRFSEVSAHRRSAYRKGEIKNAYIRTHCESGVQLLTCTVDVHKSNLAVAVWGWTAGMTCWLIDYFRIYDDSETGCGNPESPAWSTLTELIEDKTWTSDDGKVYRAVLTLIDSGWSPSTVTDFCARYESGVYPIKGRDTPGKNQSIKEFAQFQTQAGTTGYMISVDHYKDRLNSVLKREWKPEIGSQRQYTFNAPLDSTDEEMKELTREWKRKKVAPNGSISWYWHRPQGAENELWDLMVYGHASVEILAWSICIQHFEEESVDWPRFWRLIEENELYFSS